LPSSVHMIGNVRKMRRIVELQAMGHYVQGYNDREDSRKSVVLSRKPYGSGDFKTDINFETSQPTIKMITN